MAFTSSAYFYFLVNCLALLLIFVTSRPVMASFLDYHSPSAKFFSPSLSSVNGSSNSTALSTAESIVRALGGDPTSLNGTDDLLTIASALPERQQSDMFGQTKPETISCTHLLVDFNVLRHVLFTALQNGTAVNRSESTTIDKHPGVNITSFSIIGPTINNLKVTDEFEVVRPELSSGILPKIEMLHGWVKITGAFLKNSTAVTSFTHHTVMFRLKSNKKVLAMWQGQVFVAAEAGIYQSTWTGTSVNMADSRLLLNMTWHIHAARGQSCWFGDATSFVMSTGRNLTRWTHLIEYPGNDTWCGFVIVKNLLNKLVPTQFWAGIGNSTADVLLKTKWKDYTNIWLGIDDDLDNADRQLARGWIWTTLTSAFMLCAFISSLVFWLTRERIDVRGRRQPSWMTVLARSKRRLRNRAATVPTISGLNNNTTTEV